MTDTFPSISPNLGGSEKRKTRVLKARFGDGYVQRGQNGLNHVEVSWSLKWKGLNLTDKNQIIDFLESQGGFKAFFWTPPDDTQQKWTCERYGFTKIAPNQFDVTANFDLSFEL